jgi:Protein of unknown function DUF2625
MLPIAARCHVMASIRDIDQLAAVDRPAWPRVNALAQSSTVDVTVLPVARSDGERVLHRLQVTARSPLGAVALNTGGLVVDHGWLRVLGGGGAGLRDLAKANRLTEPRPGRPAPEALVFAYDPLGGRYALNGGALPGERGEVCYWGPDTLEWTPLEMGHGAFLEWIFAGGLSEFCRELRWSGWEKEIEEVGLDEGLACFPFLFSAEGRDVTQTTRTVVPFDEILLLHDDLARQLADVTADRFGMDDPSPGETSSQTGEIRLPGPAGFDEPLPEPVPVTTYFTPAQPQSAPALPLRRPWRDDRLAREYSLPREFRGPRGPRDKT